MARSKHRHKGRKICRQCLKYRRLLKIYKLKIMKLKDIASSKVNNTASIDGKLSGLVNIIVQVPVNLGDATSFNKSDANTNANVL